MAALSSHVTALAEKAALARFCRGRHLSSGPAPRVVVAGCGFAGASTALHLSRRGAAVTLVDPRPPLSATSANSTESYRTYFMDPAMVPFMQRSVDILESLTGEENRFHMNRRGYCFLAASQQGQEVLERSAAAASSYGAGEVRSHREGLGSYRASPVKGFSDPALTGFDLVYGSERIRELFPFVSPDVQLLMHARRCGWLDGQGFGQAMLEEAKAGSAKLLKGSVRGFDLAHGAVQRVRVEAADGREEVLECEAFVNAAGAWMPLVNELLGGEELPLRNELHAQVVFNDPKGIVPQESAGMMVWRDPIAIGWDEATREGLLEMDDTEVGGMVNSASWLETQPGGLHFRPAGNGRVVMLWPHLHNHVPLPADPPMPVPEFLEMYPQLCFEGLQTMVPAFAGYSEQLGRSATHVMGGYYTVTPDGRPVVGRHGAENAFVCGGMGTYGLMGSSAAGELAALHVLGHELPKYAGACTWPRLDPLLETPINVLGGG